MIKNFDNNFVNIAHDSILNLWPYFVGPAVHTPLTSKASPIQPATGGVVAPMAAVPARRRSNQGCRPVNITAAGDAHPNSPLQRCANKSKRAAHVYHGVGGSTVKPSRHSPYDRSGMQRSRMRTSSILRHSSNSPSPICGEHMGSISPRDGDKSSGSTDTPPPVFWPSVPPADETFGAQLSDTVQQYGAPYSATPDIF